MGCLIIHYTTECHCSCEHCMYASTAGAAEVFARDKFAAFFAGQSERCFGEIWIAGGEPLLHAHELLDFVRMLRSRGNETIGLVTSGGWHQSAEVTRCTLSSLRNAGLVRLSVSMDHFHQKAIPVEQAKDVVRIGRELFEGNTTVSCYTISSERLRPEYKGIYDVVPQHVIEASESLGVPIFRGEVLAIGRAHQSLSDVFCPACPDTFHCPLPDFMEGDLMHPESLEVYPNGDLTACPCLPVGHLGKLDFCNWRRSYSVLQDDVLATLWRSGPLGLLDLLPTEQTPSPDTFFDGCDLCQVVRRRLSVLPR